MSLGKWGDPMRTPFRREPQDDRLKWKQQNPVTANGTQPHPPKARVSL